jgi:UDP-N-acetylglucosamine 2-epimerase
MRLMHVVGARPNFMKAASVLTAVAQYSELTRLLVHTGQHYDDNMSRVFFRDLGLPAPDVNLDAGSCSHSVQTAEIMLRIERVLLDPSTSVPLRAREVAGADRLATSIVEVTQPRALGGGRLPGAVALSAAPPAPRRARWAAA